MTAKYGLFHALHKERAPGDPLILPGPWDPPSARAFVKAGYPALATPSAGVAAALGHEDGHTPADEMFAAVARIAAAVDVPVSADIEAGYGLPPAELAERLLDAGVVGCNLEDSVPDPAGGADKVLRDPAEQATWLGEFAEAAAGRVFLNARVDTFLRGVTDPEESIDRGRRYSAAGADCLYFILATPAQIPALRKAVPGPINASAMPGRDNLRELGELGATRITFGPGLLLRTMKAAQEIAAGLK
ncbi:isocitrate lyase/phosphoenolpyruvate mutase family protein [Streptomyces sp. NA04227]|uniref:isocitrate lyase/PEP mutase family protein n=1 Tax=Streptomyces sp. NA04227 TaxID=2742136 RepID=UPI00159059DC|nr:isocitrate lyase/phosphoenolpyruvate mutase family protein [Streptomyces sp. NA04227]QKW08749.1 isocitrate lyase/phosphoenolpyruvate mutase family protein [Streptomyces sp. NA04227]